MTTTQAWIHLANAEQLPAHDIDEMLGVLATRDVEQAIVSVIEHAPEGWKAVWREALVTRLRRRLLIPAA